MIRRTAIVACLVAAVVCVAHVGAQRPAGAAWLSVALDTHRTIDESRPDMLDAPLLPGSVVKAVALVAALEDHVIEPDTARICRRRVTVDGHEYTCSHPDLARPLTPAEALAHSCNDFFVSLAQRLSRTRLNDVRARIGLPPVPATANFAAALVGLDGPRVSPRVLLAAMTRLIGADPSRPMAMTPEIRRVLLDGLRGAATYGSASELATRGVSALAKTGTAPMPGGSFLGLTVAFTPANAPVRGLIVVAPGAAGRDATSIAGDLLASVRATPRVGAVDADGAPPATAKTGGRVARQVTPRGDIVERQTVTSTTDSRATLRARATGDRDATPVTSTRRGTFDRARPAAVESRATSWTGDRASDARAALRVGITRSSSAAQVKPSSDNRSLPERSGTLRIGAIDSRGTAQVTSMTLEDYVARVVAGESTDDMPDAVRRALAVAVRTYALANRGRHQAEGFDLCDTTHCQVLRPATSSSRRATAATAGQVLMFRDQPAPIFYSASCGGHTEHPSSVWPGAVDYPFLPSQADVDCDGDQAWTTALSADQIERALRAAGLEGNGLRRLRVVKRSASGRVVGLVAEGFSPSNVSGETFRLAVGRTAGWQLLKSNAYELTRDARGYVFRGRGFGHGVGLCVAAAACRARAGQTTEQILGFYYPGLRTAVDAASKTASRLELRLALPASDENDRDLVTNIIQRARDEIASRAMVPSPPAISVTVHPTVQSFARASRQPWWVGAATRGTRIDLVPLPGLRRRGLLESTLRHEIAHVLLDTALADRPMWVREGAAGYFSGSAAAVPAREAQAPVRETTCPTDVELMKAASWEAQRDAYARAEQCFARRIAGGQRWQDVR